jgi:hypothetical protein
MGISILDGVMGSDFVDQIIRLPMIYTLHTDDTEECLVNRRFDTGQAFIDVYTSIPSLVECMQWHTEILSVCKVKPCDDIVERLKWIFGTFDTIIFDNKYLFEKRHMSRIIIARNYAQLEDTPLRKKRKGNHELH